MTDEKSALLRALQLDKDGDWDQAHSIAQAVLSQNGSLVHAYLHRKEGDIGNASYWYSRADSVVPEISLEQEWQQLVDKLSADS